MDIKTAIRHVSQNMDLDAKTAAELIREIMTGQCSDAQVGAFLVALQMKGVTGDELLGATQTMRELATAVHLESREHLVDTCGTGGTGSESFNISTASAMVASCAGARVAKHGNRGATSKSGSADVLEAAGVNLSITPEQVARCIEELGVGFMFAPGHHGAMKHVIGPRREIGVRTVFNLLGPLTNPAGAPNQLMGIFDRNWIDRVLTVLKELGSEHVLVVAAEDGLDEISTAADTHVGELKNGRIEHYTIGPEDFGVERRDSIDALRIASPGESLALVRDALAGKHAAAADIVVLNAGAAIYAAGRTGSLADGVVRAREIIDSGEALDKLQALADLTQSFAD
ncbi:MAG: anthranilate phosphoribosyltransferase [Pseudohongiellaceae bacterium]